MRLFASLRDRLPGDPLRHRGRGVVEVEEGASLQQLLDTLKIPERQAQMVLVNGEQAPRDVARRSALALREGDTVSIFPPLAGG